MIYYFYGVKKYIFDYKVFGCVCYKNCDLVLLFLCGFLDDMVMLVSCWIEMKCEEIEVYDGLEVLIDSIEIGFVFVCDLVYCVFYVFNYFEYDSGMLKEEYDCDVEVGILINVLVNYYFDDDLLKDLFNCWRSYVYLLYGNWINEIYQIMLYDIQFIGF